MYEVFRVPDYASDLTEQLGTKPKFWFRDGDRRLLFKEGRPGTGENWAEKVGCEIAASLDIPHAHYELASWKDRTGVISQNFVPESGRLVLGNELLAQMVAGYHKETRFKEREHTVSRVMAIMRFPVVGTPLTYVVPAQLRSAADTFVGYLMLDALIGNQDRHHENWGLVVSPPAVITQAPTFDHASSLGRNESDETRRTRLTTRDQNFTVERYVIRARSAFHSGGKQLSTLEAFAESSRLARPAAAYWLRNLERTNIGVYEGIFANIPDTIISSAASEFAMRMIVANRARLLQITV